MTANMSVSEAQAQVLYKQLAGHNFYRILELHKGSRSEPLKGTLFQHASLDKPSLYEALSYRWSEVDSNNPTSIEIDGVPFLIGPGLCAALLQFRKIELQRYLWIDQICINQRDQTEKLQQIDIMGDIYRKAQRALIWLGSADDQSDVAMELFPILVRQLVQHDHTSSLQPSNEPPVDVIEHKGSLATILSRLFTRAWFGRVWTLQEATLAPKAEVWCGEKSFPFSVLGTFERGCHTDSYGHWGNFLSSIPTGPGSADPENPNRALTAHIYVVSNLREGAVLSSARILNSLRSLDCSERKDRICSVSRFLPPDLRREIQKQELTPAELYRLVATEGLRRGEIDFLCAAGLAQHRLSYAADRHGSSQPHLTVPSWVPDWTYSPRTHSYWVLNDDCLQKRGNTLFGAGGLRPDEHHFSFSDDGQTLHASAVFIGKITEFAAPFRVERVPEDATAYDTRSMTVMKSNTQFHSYIASCMQLAVKCSSRYGSSNAGRACRRALVGRMMPGGQTTPRTGVLVRASDEAVDSIFEDFETRVSMLEETEWWIQRVRAGPPYTNDDMARSSKHMAAMRNATNTTRQFSKRHNLEQAMAEACKGRRFFITDEETRHVGVAPDIARSGDEIYLVPGCCAPFVVRPHGDHYQLIGECYVDGIMDGEGMERDVSMKPITFI